MHNINEFSGHLGMQIIRNRVDAAKAFALHSSVSVRPEVLATFTNHVVPLIQKGIDVGIINPNLLVTELGLPANKWSALLSVDLLLWHIYWDVSKVGYPLLNDPFNKKFSKEYDYLFRDAHRLFTALRILDQEPGFDRDRYIQLVKDCAATSSPELVKLVLQLRYLDHSMLTPDSVFPLVLGADTTSGLDIPSPEKWLSMRDALARSILLFYSNLADHDDRVSLVRDMKDFAVPVIYPEVWNYVDAGWAECEGRMASTGSLLADILHEIQSVVRKAGLEVELHSRSSKSKGSLALKVKKNFEDSLVKFIAKEAGIPRSLIQINAYDPRISEVSEGRGIDLLVDSNPCHVSLENRELKIHLPNDIVLSKPVKLWGDYIFEPIFSPDTAHDLVAARVILLGADSESSERILQRRLGGAGKRRTNNLDGVVDGAIANTIRGRGISFRTAWERFEKPGYSAIHADTTPDQQGHVPFEIKLQTSGQYKTEKTPRGDGNHSVYKDRGGALRDVLDALANIPVNAPSAPEHLLTFDKATFSISIIVDGKPLIESATEYEGTKILDVLAAHGVNLTKVRSVTAKKSESDLPDSIGVLASVQSNLTLFVNTAPDVQSGIIKPELAKTLISIAVRPETHAMLREIMKSGGLSSTGKLKKSDVRR